MTNTTKNFFIYQYFSVYLIQYEQLKFGIQLGRAWKKFYDLGARIIWKNSGSMIEY